MATGETQKGSPPVDFFAGRLRRADLTRRKAGEREADRAWAADGGQTAGRQIRIAPNRDLAARDSGGNELVGCDSVFRNSVARDSSVSDLAEHDSAVSDPIASDSVAHAFVAADSVVHDQGAPD